MSYYFILTHQTATKARQQGGEMSRGGGGGEGGYAYSHLFQDRDDICPQKSSIYDRALSLLPLVDNEHRKEEYRRRMVCMYVCLLIVIDSVGRLMVDFGAAVLYCVAGG